jgi:hypothetical protein
MRKVVKAAVAALVAPELRPAEVAVLRAVAVAVAAAVGIDISHLF